MSDIECPKCGLEHEPSGSHEDDSGEWTCDNCGFVFIVEIEYDPYYIVECKNHEWGDWREWMDYDPQYKTRRCSLCEAEDVELLPDE